jgi:hypothetical protein
MVKKIEFKRIAADHSMTESSFRPPHATPFQRQW